MQRPSTKINNLQAVRAIAALAVVIYHTGIHLPGLQPTGAAGVDVFFVLSGYIMARICEKTPEFFFRRRLIRILPPYWVLTILLFFAAQAVPSLMGSTKANVGDLLKSLFFIPFIKHDGVIRPLLFVGWSLNYEMFFYIAVALGLFLFKKRAIAAASALILALHFIAVALPFQNVWLQFLRAYYIVEFSLGALAYYVARAVAAEAATRRRSLITGLIVLGAAILVALGLWRPQFSIEILSPLLYAGAATAVVLGVTLLSKGGWDTRLAPLVLLGDASYVLYLSHPYCEDVMQRALAPRVPLLHIDAPLGCLLTVCVSVAVGVLLHLYAERPALARLNPRFGGRRSAEFSILMETRGQVNP